MRASPYCIGPSWASKTGLRKGGVFVGVGNGWETYSLWGQGPVRAGPQACLNTSPGELFNFQGRKLRKRRQRDH